ncbi:MCE family protein [bacterium]|nr:MCE family protein [candidate division CSSED10-310 bacterium]
MKILVVFDMRHGIQPDARVLMNDVQIGRVSDLTLRSSRESVLEVTLDEKYTMLLNSSTVFTFSADPADRNRNCLICKNCSEPAPPLTPGQEFSGMGILRYAVACLSRQFDGNLKQTLETEIRKAVESGEAFSSDVMRMLEDLAMSNREAFEKMLQDVSGRIERMDAETQKRLDELRMGVEQRADELQAEEESDEH